MEELIIPIDGRDTKIGLKRICIGQLKLDELNPRISFFRDNQLEDSLTDDQIIFALTNKNPEAFRKLKDSIHNNRGAVNPIWIEPIKGSKKQNFKFRVIEGNSRVVIYQKLKEEEPYEKKWKEILCYILPYEIKDEQKNFIRLQSHLRGTTEWDAYEKAKYLYKLWQEDGWSPNRLEKHTKMTEKQIIENINAYRIMEEQYLPNYGNDPNEVNKFSYFVEYVKDKKLQKIMKKVALGAKDFCSWVSDKEKLPTGQDVRKLRYILEADDSKDIFIKNGFEDALQILEFKKPNLISNFYRDIESVVDGLKNLSQQELDEIISEEKGEREKLIREIAKWSGKVIKLIESQKHGV